MRSLLCIAVIALLGVSAQSSGCNQNGAWSTNAFNSLISNLTAQKNEIYREELALAIINDQNQGFTSSQVVTLLGVFVNEISQQEVITNISSFILGMTCQDVYNILMTYHNEISRLEILPLLSNLTTDLNKNNQTIIGAFTNYFNKQDAQTIIDNSVQLSCVWGDVTAEKNVLFIIDISGSMSTTFTASDGNTYTRFQFVQQQLVYILQNVLQSYQMFNILTFSDSTNQCFSTMAAVNTANTNAAVQWLAKFSPNGGTNMLSAIQVATKLSPLNAIFLLSDGQPNSGQNNQIISTAQTWSQGNHNSPVNTISFQAGGTFDPTASAFMNQIASVTDGVYRSIN